MKRRAFFGFAAGAAVAGPGLAKEVAAKAAAEMMSVGGGSGLLASGMASAPFGAFAPQSVGLLQRAASSMSFLRSLTRDQRAELRRRFGDVHRLDADLASYHSMSMAARIEMQRERNVDTFLANRKTWWQGVLDRGDNDYASDPFNDI
jgi:hypothetical protein